MAITFLEQRKKQQKLLPVLVGILMLILFIVWWGFLREETISPVFEGSVPAVQQKVGIDFDFLRNLNPEDFYTFEKVPPLEEEVGKENPFIPFNLESEE